MAIPHHPSFDGCFGCRPDPPCGLHGSIVHIGDSTALVRYTIAGWQQGAPGVAHGGILAAAMDETLGLVVWSLGRRYVTARLETDFVAPVPLGAQLTVRARCTGVSGRKAYAEAEAFLGEPSGPVAVRATALFVEQR